MQWDGTNLGELCDFFDEFPGWSVDGTNNSVIIETLEGNHLGLPGDWIIKGTKGEFYPCKPDIFVGIYEAVG